MMSPSRCRLSKVERALVGDVTFVACPPDVTTGSELRLGQNGCIARQQQIDRAAAQCYSPSANALFQSIHVPAVDQAHAGTIRVEQAEQHITLGVGNVAVDLAGVRGDVVKAELGSSCVHGIGPSSIVQASVDGAPCSSNPST